jgi:transcriptional regulator with XRE-family HTH domain
MRRALVKLDGDKVQWARERLGYSMETTAEVAGVAKNSVLRAEHGGDIRPVTARKLAGALGLRVEELLPKAQAPLPFDVPAAAPNPLSDAVTLWAMPQGDFLRVLSESDDETLLEIYRRIDGERTALELEYRNDESGRAARSAFLRAVERRMVVLLTLVERGVAPTDPERASLAEQLEHALGESR